MASADGGEEAPPERQLNEGPAENKKEAAVEMKKEAETGSGHGEPELPAGKETGIKRGHSDDGEEENPSDKKLKTGGTDEENDGKEAFYLELPQITKLPELKETTEYGKTGGSLGEEAKNLGIDVDVEDLKYANEDTHDVLYIQIEVTLSFQKEFLIKIRLAGFEKIDTDDGRNEEEGSSESSSGDDD